MDTSQVLSDECNRVLIRAGQLAADRGKSQITSEDLLAAMTEQPESGAAVVLDSAATEKEVDPGDLREEIKSKYDQKYGG